MEQSSDVARAMRSAIADDAFFLELEPQIDLATGQVVGFECLARWAHPQQGVLAPASFLGVLEATN